MIKLGTNSIGKVYLGSNSIGKAYLGSNLVFQKGSSPTPSIQPVFYDRIVFDGIAYIDTDITPPSDFSCRCRFGNESLKAAQRLFMCAAGTNQIGAMLGSSTTSTTRQFNIYYGASSAVSGSYTLDFSTIGFNFYLTPKGWGFGDEYNTFTKGSSSPSGVLILGSRPTHNGQPYSGRMGTFTIYGDSTQDVTSYSGFDNYTPLYTLRPCTYNGEAGMWCVETSTFYGNTAGAGLITVANL